MPFVVRAIPQASQAKPEVIFHGQWVAEKINDNIDSIKVQLPTINAFSPLKNIQFRTKFLYNAPTKQ